MSPLLKLVLIGATSLAVVSVEAHVATPHGEQVLAAHRQVAAPTPVVYHRHHRRHHVHHRVHRPAHR